MTKRRTETPYLVEDDKRRMRQQREDEQKGKRAFAAVHAKDHENDYLDANQNQHSNELGEGMQAGQEGEQHPLLDSQLYDGADKALNVNVDVNPSSKVDLENLLREQELEHQLRLGLHPELGHEYRPSTKPRPF